jgi:endonuclease V
MEHNKTSTSSLVNQKNDKELTQKWTIDQITNHKKLILTDTEPWQLNRRVASSNEKLEQQKNEETLRYVAGLDISFVKDSDSACVALIVFDLADSLNIVYKDLSLVEMTLPYVSGFLAYREAPFYIEKLQRLKEEKPQFYPQCLLIDGNGILHFNKFGMACHLGEF